MSDKQRRRQTIIAVVGALLGPFIGWVSWIGLGYLMPARVLDYIALHFAEGGRYVALGTCIGIGLLFVLFLPTKVWVRVLAGVLYIPAMCLLMGAFQNILALVFMGIEPGP